MVQQEKLLIKDSQKENKRTKIFCRIDYLRLFMDRNKSFGSFLPLEIYRNTRNRLYENAIMLNTGRNALEYILKQKKVKKVFIPFYSCDAILTPIRRLEIDFEYYNINENFEPTFNFDKIGDKDIFLYINFFGLKNRTVIQLAEKVRNLVIDNSQALFSRPSRDIPTFYSVRKFCGVPDGALLCNIEDTLELEVDESSHRIDYLVSRIENEVEQVHEKYRKCEEELDNAALKRMSEVTLRFFSNIDFKEIFERRKSNVRVLEKILSNDNKLSIETEGIAPLAYPLLIEAGKQVKEELKKNRIYLATYWPNVVWHKNFELESYYAENILPIPVDQRYNEEDMLWVGESIKKAIKKK